MLPFRSGRFRRLGAAGFFFSFLLGVTLAAEPKKSNPRKTSTPAPGQSKTPAPLTNVPLPIGQEAKGLVLPDFDLTGHMRSRLQADLAKREDADHMSFKGMKMTTFTPQNTVDMMIEMASSVLDLNTRVIVSHERTTVSRSDFHISGDRAEFDTVARKGTLDGNVKMVVQNASQLRKKPTE